MSNTLNNPTNPTQILEALNWRYAVKAFDKSHQLTTEELNLVKEALRLSPSSFGIQGWKFVEVVSPELREQIKATGWGQGQYTDSSNLFAVCTYVKPDGAKLVQDYLDSIVKVRGVAVESLDGYKKMMMGRVSAPDAEQWFDKQAYITIGQATAACAVAGIDAIAMEGFDGDKVNEILDLAKDGLKVLSFFAVGKRDETDKYQQAPKVRFDQNVVFSKK